MSILTAVIKKFSHFLEILSPKRPRLAMGKHLSNMVDAYAQVTSIAYLTALQREPNSNDRNAL
jgi:hypothetical protein